MAVFFMPGTDDLLQLYIVRAVRPNGDLSGFSLLTVNNIDIVSHSLVDEVGIVMLGWTSW